MLFLFYFSNKHERKKNEQNPRKNKTFFIQFRVVSNTKYKVIKFTEKKKKKEEEAKKNVKLRLKVHWRLFLSLFQIQIT